MPIEPPDPPLTDGVVTLRAMRPDDLPAVGQAAADQEIVRWFDAPADVLAGWLEGWRDGSAAALAVCAPPERCVGHVLVELRNSGRAHVEYWLLPDARGHGLAARALMLASRLGVRRARAGPAGAVDGAGERGLAAVGRAGGLPASCAGTAR